MSRKGEPLGELNGFLDRGSKIVGELHFRDTFRVDGQLRGKVSSEGDLIVGQDSTVEGDIRVRHLFVSGIVRGSVVADRVEIAPGARVEADVETPALLIEEGAHFQGRCVMDTEASASHEREGQGVPLGEERFVGRHDGQRITGEKRAREGASQDLPIQVASNRETQRIE